MYTDIHKSKSKMLAICSSFAVVCLIASVNARSTHNDGNEVIKDPPLPSVPSDFLEAYYYGHYSGLPYLSTYVRDGDASETTSCTEVRDVPDHLRSPASMRPAGLSRYYTKYTEAYGIPVVAGDDVPDAAVKRACYVLRFLLADRQDLRQAYYKNFGRVGVIPHDSTIKTIPEYHTIADEFSAGTRGLGAIPMAPISTAGEENVLCYEEDNASDDLMIREIAQGILHLAAKSLDPGIAAHLKRLYQTAMESGWWDNTYAEHSPEAYFGEGVQSFFNVNSYADPADGYNNAINTRSKLQSYDSALYSFVQQLFPCANNYIKRCSSRGNESYQRLRMDCSGLHLQARSAHQRHSRRSFS